jgi:ubiquitin-protein ligase
VLKSSFVCISLVHSPNVDAIGRICLDILKDKWSPALRLTAVCLSLQSLLASPNPDDPLDNVCFQNIFTHLTHIAIVFYMTVFMYYARLIIYSFIQNVANVWKSNPRQANATAREWTRKYAMV